MRLQLGPVNVSGGLSPAQVSQTLQANLADIGQCYTAALKRNAGLTGYLDLLVSISPAGQIQRARLERSTVPDRTLVQCVGQAMVAVRFPAAAEATTGNVLLLFLGFLGPPAPDPDPPDSPERKVPPRLPRIEPPPEAPTITGQSLVMGLLRDASTNQPVVGAVVLILNPGVRVSTLDRSNLAANTATTAVSSSLGYFRTARALPQGQAYGIVIAARGYNALGVDDAVKLMRGTPPVLNLGLIRLRPLGY